MSPRDPSGYRHGLHIRLGSAIGPKGVLLRCEKRDGSGTYWRIRMHSGEWIWPDRRTMIVDGPGEVVNPSCGSCGLPFVVRSHSNELICEPCATEEFGPTTREPDSLPHRRTGFARSRHH